MTTDHTQQIDPMDGFEDTSPPSIEERAPRAVRELRAVCNSRRELEIVDRMIRDIDRGANQ